ncbi:MAG: hypothetical protein EBW84_06715 [Betaproteobacteria bacterium]|nr:hypothetical protein [Betaproteobacteria bacterium]
MSTQQSRLPWWSRALSALLIIAFAYLLGYWLSKWLAPKPLAAPAASLAPALELMGSASKQAAESLGLLFSRPPAPATEATVVDVKLHGVLFAGAESSIVASISGEKPRVYRQGDAIGAYRVQSIQQDAALLKQADGRLTKIELPKPESLLR